MMSQRIVNSWILAGMQYYRPYVEETSITDWNNMISFGSCDTIVIKKLCFQCFPSKTRVFKSLSFEERSQKAPFSWRISVDAQA